LVVRKIAHCEFLDALILIDPVAQQAEHPLRSRDVGVIDAVDVVEGQILHTGIASNIATELDEVWSGAYGLRATKILG
jgi:hypothetical protein